jgi:hypothetical protein
MYNLSMNETRKNYTQVYGHTYMTRNYNIPKIVEEENFDGWSECDTCGRKLDEYDTVFTHWHTVYSVYYTESKTPHTKEVLKFMRDYNKLPTMVNDYDNFSYVTCSKRCSMKH